ncbi:MAG: hypothetical protein J0H74_26270 [Chitinophagaceae bacterium]|nr:hypothetical protein [Chitinophagaceae bacterium]
MKNWRPADANYLTLAQNEVGILSLRQSGRSTKIKFHSVEDESDIRDLGDKFVKALEDFLQVE